MALLIVLSVVIVIIAIAAITLYNRLVRLKNTAQSSWSDIDVQLKKRFDLIPSLVETVKGYASHEKEVLTRLTEARSMMARATGPADMARSENMLKDTLKSLFAVAEAYPDLKANQNFMQLQQQLSSLEDGIEQARRYYNAVVRDYNTMIESFPSNIVASMFGFQQREFFQLDMPDVERKPVKPDFS
ncbi:MAG: LemA family protein [candidate division Zixibacteria bacterium]|jgi:LemA protein|nr:LemA family protein [candidate division Zixibacteria bacterium]